MNFCSETEEDRIKKFKKSEISTEDIIKASKIPWVNI